MFVTVRIKNKALCIEMYKVAIRLGFGWKNYRLPTDKRTSGQDSLSVASSDDADQVQGLPAPSVGAAGQRIKSVSLMHLVLSKMHKTRIRKSQTDTNLSI